MELGKSLFTVGESKYLSFYCSNREYHLLLEMRNCAEDNMEKTIAEIQGQEIKYGLYDASKDLDIPTQRFIKTSRDLTDFLNTILQIYRRGDTWMTCNQALEEMYKIQYIQSKNRQELKNITSGMYLRKAQNTPETENNKQAQISELDKVIQEKKLKIKELDKEIETKIEESHFFDMPDDSEDLEDSDKLNNTNTQNN